ncbi:SIR2 family protein [Bacteroides sp. 519]|uniref:SIR2 family protein n=1 Tax=Bacteroides sp. 519 TaxID=2302937 RepID=UPI0013D1CFB1|nr:SIR2 family protein [Bacteroides sp. 519]NDV57019.1 hypothetical protein [Bacteroides sp. 519]
MYESMGQLSLWEDRSSLVKYLANKLKDNSLSLVLGAGVSNAFGLPGWAELITTIEHRIPFKCNSDDVYEKGNELRDYFEEHGGYSLYLDAVQAALYKEIKDDFEELNDRKILDAIAALCIPSRRGSVKDIITFNFDNILEIYLRYYGIVSYSPVSGNSWRTNSDVNIFHIHGFLPKDRRETRSESIVFDGKSYKERVDYSNWEWAPQISSLLRCTTSIYIGLSGNDDNMERFVRDSEVHHAYKKTSDLFWGITFIRDKGTQDANHEETMRKIIDKWKAWKIFPIIIKNKDDDSAACGRDEFEAQIKSFLYAISQEAACL